MSVVVVATITPKPDQVDAVREAILAAVPEGARRARLRAVRACTRAAGEFVMVERWESPEALKVHGTAEALTTLGGQLAGKLAGAPDVRRLTAVPAGDPVKGAV